MGPIPKLKSPLPSLTLHCAPHGRDHTGMDVLRRVCSVNTRMSPCEEISVGVPLPQALALWNFRLLRTAPQASGQRNRAQGGRWWLQLLSPFRPKAPGSGKAVPASFTPLSSVHATWTSAKQRQLAWQSSATSCSQPQLPVASIDYWKRPGGRVNDQRSWH